jgi:PIN domain nuclease of toxin-antitoxin system
LEDSPELGVRARRAIVDPRNQVFVSAASVWEIAIKSALGKVQVPEDLLVAIEETGFTELGITSFHAEKAGYLPLHHRDPFDRMLVAQAQAEGLTIVTKDTNIPLYGVSTMAT